MMEAERAVCAVIVINNDGNFLKRLVAVEFVADRKNKLVSALILELESWFHYYCFCSRLRRCMHLN